MQVAVAVAIPNYMQHSYIAMQLAIIIIAMIDVLTRLCTCRSPVGVGLIKVSVTYMSDSPLVLKYPYGFEVGCTDHSTLKTSWMSGTAKSVDKLEANVEFGPCSNSSTPTSIRYCWRTDPCTFKMCPIYGKDLPSPPFVMKLD